MKYERKISASMKRFTCDDQDNEFYTLFRYTPIEGLGQEEGVGRRDPSNVIKVGDTYYLWYTKITGALPKVKGEIEGIETPWEERQTQWDLADIWYATSKDGYHWEEQSCAVARGSYQEYDYRSVFTCNIFVENEKYYLCYQTLDDLESKPDVRNAIGMSVATSPDGPWVKLPKPILCTGNFNLPIPQNIVEANDWYEAEKYVAFDSRCVHDPQIYKRQGKYWLYYKGHPEKECLLGDKGWQGKQGVAIADHPEGPYVKSEFNPIIGSGHEVWAWPYKSGTCLLVDWCGPEKNTIQYSEDGINFEVVSTLNDLPQAGGAYIPDLFDDPEDGQGFNWGICHQCTNGDYNYLVRFDCELMQNQKKDFSTAYFTYAKVRNILLEEEKFLSGASKERKIKKLTNE